MRATVASLIASSGLLVACGGGGDGGITGPPPGAEPVAAVVVTPAEARVEPDEQVELTAETRAADGTVLTGRTITWISSDETVATVAPTSGAAIVVTGHAFGVATITATSEGRQGTAEISVERLGFQLVVTPQVDTVVVGQTVQFRAEARAVLDGTLLPATFTWSAKDQDPAAVVAEVDPATGVATGRAAGEALIVASPAGLGGTGSARLLVLAFRQASAGGRHTCAVTTAGAAYCWGDNEPGQLGDGTDFQRRQPVPVAGGLSVEAVSAGSDHTCSVTTGGAAYCWGANELGELGDGTTTDSRTPVAVSGNHTFAAVAAGATHTCGLNRFGVGYCWGENRWGQLGDGTTDNSLEPVAVATSSPPPLAVDFAQIAAGHVHTCGVSPRGAASCWGRNDLGQLGDGTTLTRLSPSPVAPPVGQSTPLAFTALSLGVFHTCGLTPSGVIYCWGANSSGQLGDGTTADRARPAAVQALVSFRAITAGATHACALSQTGRAYCWGDNAAGQLGDGTTTPRSIPVVVSGDLAFASLTAGSGFTCGVTPDGRA
ncbi:MAG: Ig-like domain-containing protein, partial [Gemmatimonadales bacterium]